LPKASFYLRCICLNDFSCYQVIFCRINHNAAPGLVHVVVLDSLFGRPENKGSVSISYNLVVTGSLCLNCIDY